MGVHEVPYELRDHLPKHCKVLDEEHVEEDEPDLSFKHRTDDLERAASDEIAVKYAEMKQHEEERQAKVAANMEKARKAKKAKRRSLKPKLPEKTGKEV
jgi:hypothetical protein